MKVFELSPFNGRKSFYGKAHIIEQDDGTKILQSYNTQVAKLTSSGELVRLWGGMSNTTAAHFKSFCIFYGLPVVPFNSLRVEA